MSKMNEVLGKIANQTYTKNGAVTNKSTRSAVLDLFAAGGASRNMEQSTLIDLIYNAIQEDFILTMKCLFYFRDIRHGLGERKVFNIAMDYLINSGYGSQIAPILSIIPEFGRWDDLIKLMDYGDGYVNAIIGDLVLNQLLEDEKLEYPSLLAKWMPSENTSSKETRIMAYRLITWLYMPPREYRRRVVALRKKIDIIENKLRIKDYLSIDYSKIPSQAGFKYKKAFLRNDYERYSQFIQDAASGKVKVNASTLYPYQIVREIISNHLHYSKYSNYSEHLKNQYQALWDNLLNYSTGDKNYLVVADVSGSMEDNGGLPMAVSVSMAIYMAQRNQGTFKNKYMTFSARPNIIEINENANILDLVYDVMHTGVGYNTDIVAVYDLLLRIMVQNNLPQSELPDKIILISDMEFDRANVGRYNRTPIGTIFDKIQEVYNQYGYNMPSTVFWNVNASGNNFPMTKNDAGMQLVSGCSPTIFETITKGEYLDPYNFMVNVLNDERYDVVEKLLNNPV